MTLQELMDRNYEQGLSRAVLRANLKLHEGLHATLRMQEYLQRLLLRIPV